MQSVKNKTYLKGRSKKKLLLTTAAGVVGLAAVAVMLEATGVTNFYHRPVSTTQKLTQQRAKVANVTGQTDAQNQPSTASDGTSTSNATNSSTSSNTSSNPASSLKSVTAILTQHGHNNGNVDAAGYINGVVEDGGTCTYTFSKGSTSFNQTTTGLANVSDTSCPSVSIPDGQFSTGQWSITLTYTSTTSTGTSTAGTFYAE